MTYLIKAVLVCLNNEKSYLQLATVVQNEHTVLDAADDRVRGGKL